MARKEVKKDRANPMTTTSKTLEDVTMAKAKKSKAKSMADRKTFTFVTKNGDKSYRVTEPRKGDKASQVVLDVLNLVGVPEGCKLRHAESYKANFVLRRGKNALGWFDTQNTLVINGIATELEDAGLKTFQPSKSKNYKAIDLKGMDDSELKTLVKTIAKVLGFSKPDATKAKASTPQKKEAEASGGQAEATATA